MHIHLLFLLSLLYIFYFLSQLHFHCYNLMLINRQLWSVWISFGAHFGKLCGAPGQGRGRRGAFRGGEQREAHIYPGSTRAPCAYHETPQHPAVCRQALGPHSWGHTPLHTSAGEHYLSWLLQQLVCPSVSVSFYISFSLSFFLSCFLYLIFVIFSFFPFFSET